MSEGDISDKTSHKTLLPLQTAQTLLILPMGVGGTRNNSVINRML